VLRASFLAIPRAASEDAAAGGSVPPGIYFGLLSLRDGVTHVLEYPAKASGDVTPLYRVSVKFGSGPYGVQANGAFWSGLSEFSADGHLLGSLDLIRKKWIVGPFALDRGRDFYAVEGPGSFLKPTSFDVESRARGCPYMGNVLVEEYASGRFGSPRPSRTIDLGNPACLYKSIAVDGRGDVFVAEEPPATGRHAHVLEFAPSATGRARPMRDIDVACPSGSTAAPDIENLRVDTSANVYGELSCSLISPGVVVAYSPSSSTPLLPIGNVPAFGLTLDGRDDVIAVVEVRSRLTISRDRFCGARTSSLACSMPWTFGRALSCSATLPMFNRCAMPS
jgi:hypothetical protein